MAPLLFNLYVNDIFTNLTNSKGILFADDTVIYSSSKNFHSLKTLMQTEINIISQWFKKKSFKIKLIKITVYDMWQQK